MASAAWFTASMSCETIARRKLLVDAERLARLQGTTPSENWLFIMPRSSSPSARAMCSGEAFVCVTFTWRSPKVNLRLSLLTAGSDVGHAAGRGDTGCARR